MEIQPAMTQKRIEEMNKSAPVTAPPEPVFDAPPVSVAPIETVAQSSQ